MSEADIESTPPPIHVEVEEELEVLVPGYLEKRRADVARMREAVAQDDLEEVRAIGHILKGSGGGYGFDRLTELGADIERAAEAGDADRAGSAIDEVDDFLRRVVVRYA